MFEYLEIDEAMGDALRAADPIGFGVAARAQESFKTLSECALEYAAQGITTLEEVFRVSEQLAEQVLETPPTASTAGEG